MLIAHQIRGPTVGAPVQDAVIALEPDAGSPQAERPSGVALTPGSGLFYRQATLPRLRRCCRTGSRRRWPTLRER